MKAGDLVRMKYIAFFMKKSGRHRVPYTEKIGIVIDATVNAVKIIFPGGTIKTDLSEYYEVVS